MKIKLTVLFFLMVLICHLGHTQNTNPNDGSILLYHVDYAYQIPSGDLAERFGNGNQLTLGMDYITPKNWLLGIGGGIFFGQDVKEDVLAPLRDIDGNIVGADQSLASLVLRERGFTLGVHIGRIFPFSTLSRSGLRLQLGGGFMQHKIRLQDDTRNVNQVEGDYAKGYDRLTNGLMLNQFIGYQHLSRNRRVNFHVGLDVFQGFTQNRRSYNFDTMSVDTNKRLDIIYALKFAWTIIPVYLDDAPDEIFY